MTLSNNYQVNDTEAKALIKGAILYAHGVEAAFSPGVLAAAWDCYCNAIKNNITLEEAVKESVLCLNIERFTSTEN